MGSIDTLEHGGGGFCLRRGGELIPMPDPRQKHYQWVLAAIHLRHVPGTPDDIPEWLHGRVFARWCAAWDLPTEFQQARRLAYLLDNYRGAISNDLHVHAGVDVGELWRARRWTLLLDLIDRLPAHSWYASAVSMDEEHAKMMAEALAAREGASDGEKTPPLTTWTPEVAMLTNVVDAVNSVRHVLVSVNSEKGKAPKAPDPLPRPVTPLERALKTADFNRRKAAHEALVARVLPHKSRTQDPVH